MMAVGLRATAKALEHPPEPKIGAPVLDPTMAGPGHRLLASGFQFWISVIGPTAKSRTRLIMNRPSGATSYCRPCTPSMPPPSTLVLKSAAGVPGSTVERYM